MKIDDKCWYLETLLNKIQVNFLVDSGASANLLSDKIYDELKCKTPLVPTKVQLYGASGTRIPVLGETQLILTLGKVQIETKFLVAKLNNLDGILGIKFLSTKDQPLDLHKGEIVIQGKTCKLHKIQTQNVSTLCHEPKSNDKDDLKIENFQNEIIHPIQPTESLHHHSQNVLLSGKMQLEARIEELNDTINKERNDCQQNIDKLKASDNLVHDKELKQNKVKREINNLTSIRCEKDVNSLNKEYRSTSESRAIDPIEIEETWKFPYCPIEGVDSEIQSQNNSLLCVNCESDETISELKVIDLANPVENLGFNFKFEKKPKPLNETGDQCNEVKLNRPFDQSDIVDNLQTAGGEMTAPLKLPEDKHVMDNKIDVENISEISVRPIHDDDNIPLHLQKLYNECCTSLDAESQQELSKLLREYNGVFAGENEPLGKTGLVKHSIDTGNAPPVKQRAYKLPIAKEEIARQEVERMLVDGLIRHSESAYSSPIVLVGKPDGSHRLCVNYKLLNKVTRKDAFPLPNIQECLTSMAGAAWFHGCDLKSGYHQVLMNDDDIPKTAFVTKDGLYEFLVMPFGLCNAPATFCRLMEKVLRGLIYKIAVLYIDDILVWGKTQSEATKNLRLVLSRLDQAGLKLKPSKCKLYQQEVKFLGHVVSGKGVKCDPDKLNAVVHWPRCKTRTDVRAFLGFTGYYRKYVQNYAEIASPLTALTSKNKVFEWTPVCEESFKNLKEALIQPPVLSYPISDIDAIFVLDADASLYSIGAVLSQVQDGKEKPLAYASRKLNLAQQRLCVTYRELLALVYFVRFFKHYLIGRRFIARVDHGSLRWLYNFKDNAGILGRWISQLAAYDMEIVHRKGSAHSNADGLSRRSEPLKKRCERTDCEECKLHPQGGHVIDQIDDHEIECEMKVAPIEIQNQTSNWMDTYSNEELKIMQDEDLDVKTVKNLVESGEKPTKVQLERYSASIRGLCAMWNHLEIKNEVLYLKWTPKYAPTELVYQLVAPLSLRRKILHHLHNQKVGGGHLGITKTLEKIRSRFYWSGCKSDVTKWLEECPTCARVKPGPGYRSELTKVTARVPNEYVGMDLLGPLPQTESNNVYILVVIEYFTKWVECYPLKDITAYSVADVFCREYITHYGLPQMIITDQGRQFESKLYQEMCTMLGIDKRRGTPFHPRTDGLSERFMSTLQRMLKCFVNDNRNDWDDLLPYVVMAYRSSVQESTQCTPNQMFLGREVNLGIDVMTGQNQEMSDQYTCEVDYVEWIRQVMQQSYHFASINLNTAAKRQKRQYDIGAKPHAYHIGQLVWRHYPPAGIGKLATPWTGPWKIVARPSDVNYSIQKRPDSEPTRVHMDSLKPFLGETPDLWKQDGEVSMGQTEEAGDPHLEPEVSDNSDSESTSLEHEEPQGDGIMVSPELPPSATDGGRRSQRSRKPPNRLDL